MPRIPGTIFMTDPQKKPAFEQHAVVTLTKDYTKSYRHCSPYLTKNAVCAVEECALFACAFDEKTKRFTKKVNEIEWCHVTISTPIFDPEEEEEYVRAVDLLKEDFDY